MTEGIDYFRQGDADVKAISVAQNPRQLGPPYRGIQSTPKAAACENNDKVCPNRDSGAKQYHGRQQRDHPVFHAD
jgi:hypothetical protein